jgi:hypothetical protein
MPKSLCLLLLAVLCLACPLAVQAQPATVGVRLPMVCNVSRSEVWSAYHVTGYATVSGTGDLDINLTDVYPGRYLCTGTCYGTVVTLFPPAEIDVPDCGVADASGHLVVHVPGFFAPLMTAALDNDHVAVYGCFGLALRLVAIDANHDTGCASGPVDTTQCAPAGGVCPCGACP